MEKYNNILRSTLECSSSFLGNTKLGFMALLWALLLSGWATNAQGYPVQVIPQVTPPPPIYLSEYADASVTNGPLRVQLLLNDFSISNREVRLRMYFDGNGLSFQSNPIVNGAAPLFLDGGVPLVLTQTDLAPYFQFENISGVSGNAYGKVLAEGSYSVCYEVIDVLTGNVLSARTCAAAIVFQNEPPLLVMPYNRAHVEEKNPQNIVFQWTPRHLNVTNVEYQLDIVEVWDNQVDPQQAFLSSPPVFSITTNSTNYVYGPADPLLLSGKRYAWRVTAKALQGTEEIGLFKNQGHSEIYSFSYAGECSLPEGVTYEVKGKSNVNLYWTDFSTDVPEYTIRYRKKEGENNEWFYSKTTSNTTTLWDLTAGTTYEYQIAKSCGIVVSDFTPVDEFTTALENEEDSLYECGIDPNFSVENTNPLASLSPGESFVAGDFPVTVETASGSNGRFTGTGFVRIPYLRNLKVAVEFTNVLVNTDSQLAEGSVRTVYDYENSSILDIDEVIDTIDTIAEQVGEFFEGDNDLDEITVNFPIADTTAIKVQDGNVVITNPANGATVTEPLGDDMVITDSEGNVYHVDAAGNVTKGGIKDSGGIVNADNVSGVNNRGEIESLTAPGIKVTFNTKGTYGMDRMPSGANAALKEEYTIIKDYEGKDYVLTHHAVKKGADTQILASIAVTGNDYTAEDLIFKTKQGETVTKDVVNGETYLKLNGHYTLESETIYAVVTSKQDTTKQLTAGAFTLWHLTERSVDVALVAVNNAQLDNYQDTIDQIFNQGVAQVNFAKPLQISITAEELGGSLDVGDSPFAAAYNAEQKMLINKVKNHPDYNRDTYYILVFNDIPASTGIAGFMPLQRQFGFVFSGSGEKEGKDGDKGKVLAHEMGHGIFALQHPFAAYGSDMKNATDWLMDYNSGTGLPHMHWAQIHNPDLKFYTFQDEEDGESVLISQIPSEFKNPSHNSYTFLTMDGGIITLPTTVTNVEFTTGLDFLDGFVDYIPGALLGFTLEDVRYSAELLRENKLNGVIVSPDGSGNETEEELDISVSDLTYSFDGYTDENGEIFPVEEFNKEYHNTYITYIPGAQKKHLALVRKEGLEYKNPGFFNLVEDYYSISHLDENILRTQEFDFHIEGMFREQNNLEYVKTNTVIYGSDWTEKHLILVKYAELNNANSTIFWKYMLEKYNINSDVSQLDIDTLLQDYVELINYFIENRKSLLEQFYYYVDNEVYETVTAESRYENGNTYEVEVSVSRLGDVIKQLSSEQLTNLDYEYREKAIKKFLTNPNKIYASEERKEGLLRLINFTPDINKSELYQFFNEVNSKEYFWKTTDVLSDTNLTTFMNLYTQLIKDYGSVNDRIEIFAQLLELDEDDWGMSTEIILAGTLYNLDESQSSKQGLYRYFRDNPQFLKYAFETLDNVNLVNPLAEFILNISSWSIEMDNPNEDFTQEDFNYYASFDFSDTGNPNLPEIAENHPYIPFTRANFFNFTKSWLDPDYDLDTSFDGNEINVQLHLDLKPIIRTNYHPLDYVLIHFQEDVYLQGTTYEKGQSYYVPALFLHWLHDSIRDEQGMVALRVLGDVLAIAAAPYSFGGSLAFLVTAERTLAMVDIYFALNKYELEQEYGPEALAYWDAAYGIFQLTQLPSIIKGVGSAANSMFTFVENVQGARSLQKLILNKEYVDGASAAFKTLSNSKKVDLLNNIDNLIAAVKAQQPFDLVSRRIIFRTLAEFKLKVSASGFNTQYNLVAEASNTSFKPNLILVGDNVQTTLAKIDLGSNNTIKIFESSKWLPNSINNVRVIGKLQDVVYNNGLNKGAIEIVENSSVAGQFFIRAAEDVPNTNGFLTNLEEAGFTNLKTLLSNFDNPEKVIKFANQFSELPESLRHLDANPIAAEAWFVLDDIGVDDAIKLDLDNLDEVAEYIGGSYKIWKESPAGINNRLWTNLEFTGSYYKVNFLDNTSVGVADYTFTQGTKTIEFDLNLPPYLQRQGVAAEIYANGLARHPEVSIIKEEYIASSRYIGGEPANLSVFKKLITGDNITPSISPEEAAFLTPSGKIIKRLNFDAAPEILINTADNVTIQFRRAGDIANSIEELTTSFKNITGITDATANTLAAKNKAADILTLIESKASVNGFPVQKLADDLAIGTDDFIDAMLDAEDSFFMVWKQVADKNVPSNISTNKTFIDKLKSLCN
ncbi:fibronectin type III domain-containing protein [Croceivirga sp. JEA036]|uniref:fibronectin type III domain-containing protein n=1 Tax=Croceivirga sp. JEA036 TaxID=2721162 RepID=UPI001438922A|nr:fibronectin type III domain-containing protein [Croceivirga sp. JEA036]NJB35911.1 fibronectin type III domain-containing protein [Croceivirga sp. JEA036]